MVILDSRDKIEKLEKRLERIEEKMDKAIGMMVDLLEGRDLDEDNN